MDGREAEWGFGAGVSVVGFYICLVAEVFEDEFVAPLARDFVEGAFLVSCSVEGCVHGVLFVAGEAKHGGAGE